MIVVVEGNVFVMLVVLLRVVAVGSGGVSNYSNSVLRESEH